jgi:hypothetical protein
MARVAGTNARPGQDRTHLRCVSPSHPAFLDVLQNIAGHCPVLSRCPALRCICASHRQDERK